MRFPIGYRDAQNDACTAAREASRLTGMRYMVRYEYSAYGPMWTFAPIMTAAAAEVYTEAVDL